MSPEDDEQLQPIKRGTVKDSLTCPICFHLLKEATTIRVCLHTFCKKCIYEKFENDESNTCPVCNADLGTCPEDTLRRDNNLENLRTMFLPKNNSKEPKHRKITKTFYRKKKKSLSSPAPVRAETVLEPISSRSKSVDQKLGYDRNSAEANSDLGSTSDRFSRDFKKKVSGDEELHRVAKTTTGPQKHLDPTSNLKQKNSCDRFSALLEIAKKHVDSEDVVKVGLPTLSIGNNVKKVDTNINRKSIRMKTRAREFRSHPNNRDTCSQNSRTEGEDVQHSTSALVSNRPTEHGIRDLTPNGCHENSQKTPHPIWLTLEGCRDGKGKSSAQPQKFYIKLPDRNLPVSIVQKYLINKLNLEHESEVELKLCGQRLVPEVTLYIPSGYLALQLRYAGRKYFHQREGYDALDISDKIVS